MTRPSLPLPLRPSLLCLALALCGASAANAQQSNADPEVLEQIRQLRDRQAQLARMQEENEQALRAQEARLQLPPPAGTEAQTAATPPTTVPAPTPAPASAPATPAPQSTAAVAEPAEPRLKINGDLRLRGQADRSDNDRPDRNSAQVRLRLGATYEINDLVTVGARLDTGDSDDPNSVDAQLSNWNDDLDFSLDLAYARLDFGDTQVYGGKLPQPFVRTDLVWDGDVSPQGLAATWKRGLSGGGSLQANSLFFLVDEQPLDGNSTMGGLQLGYSSPARGGFKFDVAGAYYRYSIGSLAGADAGDWRSNRLGPDGNLLSDFHLANVVASGTWPGLGERWPLRVVGDYVRNLGAYDGQDTGFGMDVVLGRASNPGDWRFTYGYSQTDVDAVLAAFSHDNIGIATNYRLHALTAEYVPWKKTVLGGLWYHYRPNDPNWAGGNDPDDWLDRFRIYLLMAF